MFELYNAHLRAEPAQGDVYKVTLLGFGAYGPFIGSPLPPNRVFMIKAEGGHTCVWTRSDSSGIPLLTASFIGLEGEVLECHLTQESELNSD